VFCIFTFMISMWLGTRLPMPSPVFSTLIVPVSFATILCGFFIIISRTKALTQVLGYLVIENGIYVFGMVLLHEQPVLVELAILLDIFVAVFVMGIAIFHISREFDHIDTQHLSQLRDWAAPKEEVRP
jgi:hydrogenase-4 component E